MGYGLTCTWCEMLLDLHDKHVAYVVDRYNSVTQRKAPFEPRDLIAISTGLSFWNGFVEVPRI